MPNLSITQIKSSSIESKQITNETVASVMLIHTLLADNKIKDAEGEIEATKSLAKKSQNTLLRLQFDLAFARVLLLSGRPEMSRQQSAKVLKQARDHAFVGVELETLCSRNWSKRGHDSVAQMELAELENNARRKGFGLVVRKVNSAR